MEEIKIQKQNGEIANAEILLKFELEKTGKKYIIYSFKEIDNQNMEKLHASIINETENGYSLETIPDEEWKEIKDLMREMIKSEE